MVKGEGEQNESLNSVAVRQGLEETHSPCHVTHQSWPREMRMAGKFEGLLKGIKMPHFSHQIIWVAPHTPIEVSEWGFVTSRLTQGNHWLGMWLADLIRHMGVGPWGGVYIGVLGGSGEDHWESSKLLSWLGSHKALQQLWNSQLQIPKRKRWRPPINWGPKDVSRWVEPTQAPLAHWHCHIRPLPLSLPDIFLFSAHIPFSWSHCSHPSLSSTPNQCHSVLPLLFSPGGQGNHEGE